MRALADLRDGTYMPAMDEICAEVENPLFEKFCGEIEEKYKAAKTLEFSRCSWMPGWNIKFKRSGRSLCTVYPFKGYFTVLVVEGRAERPQFELLLPGLCEQIQNIYRMTEEGNGQRWLMFELDAEDEVYKGVMELIGIRSKKR